MVEALVIWTSGNQVRVFLEGETRRASLPGRFRQTSGGVKPVAAGDRVHVEMMDDDLRIVDVMTRRNEFTRKSPRPKPTPLTSAVNLDLVIVIASAAQPATPCGLVDRLMVTSSLGGCECMLLVNKIDLVELEVLDSWSFIYHSAVPELLFTSAVNGAGTERLGELVKNRTVLFAGSSGVGKSSLANYIDPSLNIRTGEVSDATGKGKHITSVTQLHRVSFGGWLADSPGLRECAPWGMTVENISSAFPEIVRLTGECKFRDCRHRTEIGCKILSAVGKPELPESRYGNYLKLLAEAEQQAVDAPY